MIICWQIGEYVSTADKSKQRLEASKREIAALKKRIEELEAIVAKLTAENSALAKSAKPTKTKATKPEAEE